MKKEAYEEPEIVVENVEPETLLCSGSGGKLPPISIG